MTLSVPFEVPYLLLPKCERPNPRIVSTYFISTIQADQNDRTPGPAASGTRIAWTRDRAYPATRITINVIGGLRVYPHGTRCAARKRDSDHEFGPDRNPETSHRKPGCVSDPVLKMEASTRGTRMPKPGRASGRSSAGGFQSQHPTRYTLNITQLQSCCEMFRWWMSYPLRANPAASSSMSSSTFALTFFNVLFICAF